MKLMRMIAAIIVCGFLLGALASAASALFAVSRVAALADWRELFATHGQRILEPLGTLLLAGLYLLRDFLPDRPVVAISAPSAPSEPEARPSAVELPRFELKSITAQPDSDAAELDLRVRSVIAREPSGAELSAERFFVVDATGNRRGVIGVAEDGAPLLALFGSDGNAGFALGEVRGAPTMCFYDHEGHIRARLSIAGESSRLTLGDGGGVERVGIAIDLDGNPYFLLGDRDQGVRFGFAHGPSAHVPSQHQPHTLTVADVELAFDDDSHEPSDAKPNGGTHHGNSEA